MSDSVWPHRRQPTRRRRPWDSPSKNTGVGCHFLLQCVKVKSESEVAQSCPILSDPMDCSQPGSSAHGIFQARVLEWVVIVFSNSIHSGIIKPHLNQLYSNKCSVLILFWSYLPPWLINKAGKKVESFNCSHFNDHKLQMDSSWNKMIMKLLPSPCTFSVLKHPIPSLQTPLSSYDINLQLTERNQSKEKLQNVKPPPPISQDPQ